MASITLTADRRSVKKGESFSVSWTSNTPDSLVLVIDDGDSVQRVQVPDCGTRTCWSNRAAKDMSLELIAVTNGHKESSSLTVKVKSERKTETKAGIGKWQLRKEKMQARMAVSRAQFAYAWSSIKKWQRILWVLLLASPLILIIIGLFR